MLTIMNKASGGDFDKNPLRKPRWRNRTPLRPDSIPMDPLGIAISCVSYALAAPRGWPQPGCPDFSHAVRARQGGGDSSIVGRMMART